jgi:hypothetical protein
VEALVERYSERLVEDEALRGGLDDDEYQPLLDWALARLGTVSSACAAQGYPAGSVAFEQAAQQVLEVFRTADLALGERETAGPELTLSRLQLLDTLVAPPLFDEVAGGLARGRLEVLFSRPTAELEALSGAELASQIAAALG